jgi:glycosyltransferase involved in cell wall biosynthesis
VLFDYPIPRFPDYTSLVTLSVVIITHNEEANIGRTLASVQELVRTVGGEIIVVDSGSTDRTREIAESYGAKVSVEEWKGFAAQKNSAIEKASGDWVLLLDADEEVSDEVSLDIHIKISPETLKARVADSQDPEVRQLMAEGGAVLAAWNSLHRSSLPAGYYLPRKNMFLNRWIRHGGFWPDPKLRLFRRGAGRVESRAVHEDIRLDGTTDTLRGALIHHAYPTLDIYREHMRRYAGLGAEMIRHKPSPILWLNRWLNPPLTFLYNYIFRLGFLDGREGFLLHWNHSRYVSWKYAKALELSRKN